MTFLDVLPDSDEEFRELAQTWLHDNVVDKFAELKGRGGPGDEDIGFDIRVAWEKTLGHAGWIGLG